MKWKNVKQAFKVWRQNVNMFLPLSWYPDLRLSVTSFAETEELENNSLRSSGEDPHAVLKLLIPPMKQAVQGPQVLNRWYIQEVALGKPCVEAFKFICNNNNQGHIITVFMFRKMATSTTRRKIRN